MVQSQPAVPGAPAPDAAGYGIAIENAPPVKLSVVIPVYNEEATIQTLVGLVVAAPLPPNVVREIICVNDCSKDNTAARLDELPNLFPDAQFQIKHKPENQGKGAALRDGFSLATGEPVSVIDAIEAHAMDWLHASYSCPL